MQKKYLDEQNAIYQRRKRLVNFWRTADHAVLTAYSIGSFVDDYRLSTKAKHSMMIAGIANLKELTEMLEKSGLNLLMIRNCGRKTDNEIKNALE